MILETVLTTMDEAGDVNFAAMGVGWGDEIITIRPFTDTRTYRNLTAVGEAVVNVTDNVSIIARCALSGKKFAVVPAQDVRGFVLKETCYWREVVVKEIGPRGEPGVNRRVPIVTRVVGGGEVRQFRGFCRAKHAVIEASILASRLHLLPVEAVLSEVEKLGVLVKKTGGREEREAMEFVRAYIASKT